MAHRLFLPTVRTNDLELFRKTIRNCHYWYNEEDLREFLIALNEAPGIAGIAQHCDETDDDYESRKHDTDFAVLAEMLEKMIRNGGHPDDRGSSPPRNWYYY